MFACFNLRDFGEYLKRLRKSSGYSLEDVKRLSSISTATLKKIEAGIVLPRFDTLEFLSIAYKIDLLESLKNYRNSSTYFHYYIRLDNLILSYDSDVLQNLKCDFDKFAHSRKSADLLFNQSSLNQFKTLLTGISVYYSSTPACSLDYFLQAMKESNPLFHLNSFSAFKYSCLEMRILFLISLALAESNQLSDSNDILTEGLKQCNFDAQSTHNEKLLIIKIYLNLSYNFHMLDLHTEALSYANQGIEFCNKHHINYSLATLLARKGTAEFLLNLPNYKNSLNNSITLLLIANRKDLALLYVETALKIYGIVLDADII
ncbi:MAG: helix-turn-helix domain-containing protein [Alkaliphilus sp.]